MPFSESRKRPFSSVQEIYAGPEDFMEAGARGFLITTIPEREEPAIDQAMKMLRKACVKLYGGMKPQVKSTTALFSNGYIAVDFMDPELVTVLPNPELKTSKATKDQTEVKEEEEEKEKSKKTDKDTEDAQVGEKGAENQEDEKEEDADKEEEMEKENEEEQDEEMEADKSLDKSAEADKETPDEDTSNTKGKSKEAGEEKKKKEGDDDGKGSKSKETPEKRGSDGGKSKPDSQKSKSAREDERRKRDNKRRKREVDTTPKWPLMKAPYKFKAFRTELRNIMFIKSNIPDPLVLITEIMDLILDRQPLKADSINQLLPIQGICNYSYWELEVMSRRVLAPFFPEDQEEPRSFGILLFDKLSEPGADVIAEIVRSSIWSINPMAWQTNPISAADVTIHLELIGTKIVLSAMTHYMKYRQYSPFCVAELGEGKPENPDDLDKRLLEERYERKGRSRSRNDRPHKPEETPSDKGKGKDKGDDGHKKEDTKKEDTKKEDTKKEDTKKDGKDKLEESVKEETKEEDGEKSQEVAKESVKEDETEESSEKEWKKTRRGKRGGVGTRKRKN